MLKLSPACSFNSNNPVKLNLQITLEVLNQPLKNEMTHHKQVADILKKIGVSNCSIFDVAPDALLISDQQGVILLANQQAENLFGYQANEIIGLSVAFLMPERFRSLHNTRYFRIADSNTAKLLSPVLHRLALRKDNTEIEVEISLKLFNSEQSKFIVSTWRDVTKRKKMQAQLSLSEERFKTICNNTPTLMRITNAKGDPVFINQTWLDFTGLESQQAMTSDGWLKGIHPDDRKKVLTAYGEDSYINQPISKEYRLRDNNGNWRWVLDKSMPIFDENGSFDGFMSSANDITEFKQAEAELQASAARIRAILNTVVDGIIIIQQDGIVECINPAAENIFGYKPNEIIGQNINKLMPEPYHSEHDDYLQHYLKTGEKKVIGIGREVQGKRKNGSIFPIELRVNEMTIDGQRMFSGVVRDISERNYFETALRNSEVRYHSVIETVMDGIFTINEHGYVISMNPAAEKIFGFNENEVKERSIHMLIPALKSNVHENNLSNSMSMEFAKFLNKESEVQGLRKNGKNFPMHLSVSEIQVDNQPIFIGLVKNISAIKETEKVQAQYAAIIESSDDAIMSKTLKGIITSWNIAAENMFEYSANEVIGQPMSIIIPADRIEEEPKILKQIANGERIDHFETVRLTKTGKLIDISATISPIRDKTEKITGISVIARDIAERKKIDNMKNEFISTVSHELRTPLTSIQGALELVISGAMGDIPEECIPLLSIANTNSARLVRLINDILDIEKIESGKMEFVLKPVSMMGLVQDAIDANQAYADKYGVSLSIINHKITDCFVMADCDRLIQVLTNLISNAVKFSNQGESVEVSVMVDKDKVRVSVTDFGSGIPDEFKDRIFSKFSQADASSTRQKAGTGLGLSICKAIIEKLDGHIGYESVVNKKTCFYFELPVYRKITQPVVTEAKSQSDVILICEDDPDIANLLKMMLEKKGYLVDIAHDAEQAKLKLLSKPYAAMTLDLMLPGQSGIDFFKELRHTEGISDLPVIIISAISDKGKKALNGDALSVYDWLDKPIDQNRLESAINNALQNKAKNHFRILHIENDPDIVTLVDALLKNKATVDVANDLKTAELKLQQHYDLVILDMMLPDGSGRRLLPKLSQRTPPIPVVVFSAQDKTEELKDSVNASFVKSKTSNNDLVQSIELILEQKANLKKE